MSETIFIDIPGAYYSTFEGTGLVQHRGDPKQLGYPVAPVIYEAWCNKRKVVRGRGRSYRLAIPIEHAVEAIECLLEYAEAHLLGVQDELDGAWSREDRLAALAEWNAIKRLMARLDKQRTELVKEK